MLALVVGAAAAAADLSGSFRRDAFLADYPEGNLKDPHAGGRVHLTLGPNAAFVAPAEVAHRRRILSLRRTLVAATCNAEHATCDGRRATGNARCKMCDMHHATNAPRATCNMRDALGFKV